MVHQGDSKVSPRHLTDRPNPDSTQQVLLCCQPLHCPCPLPAPHVQCVLQSALIISWPSRPSAHPRVQARRM
eukprot:scaffold7387_cov32-Phaeocystis_antarctica.AAC.2